MGLKVFERYLAPDNTINVLSSEAIWDYETFFGSVTRPFYFFEIKNQTQRISDILVGLELAPTRTWCKKNKWDWELPKGYSEVEFGSKRIKLCILTNFPRHYTVEEIDEFERMNLLKGS